MVGANVAVQSGGTLTLTSGDGLEVGNTFSDAGKTTAGAGSTIELFSNPLNVTGTLTVAGKITTAGATAVTLGTGVDRLILDPGFSFVGKVQAGGANSTLELAAGTSTGVLNALGTEFTSFGKVTVDTGATWTVDALASALSGVPITGSGGSNTLTLTSAGTLDLSKVSGFPIIRLASTGANSLTLTNANFTGITTSPPSITIYGGSAGNTVNASKLTGTDRVIAVGGAGKDVFTGGAGNDQFDFSAANLAATDTVAGGGGTNYLVMTTAGTVNAGGISGVEIYDLANGGKNTLTLVKANFTGVTGSSITVNDGNAGNTVNASGADRARFYRRPCWHRRRYPDRWSRQRRVLRGRQHDDDGRGWHEPVHLQRRGQQHDRRFHRIDDERDRVQQYRIRPRPQRRDLNAAGAPDRPVRLRQRRHLHRHHAALCLWHEQRRAILFRLRHHRYRASGSQPDRRPGARHLTPLLHWRLGLGRSLSPTRRPR